MRTKTTRSMSAYPNGVGKFGSSKIIQSIEGMRGVKTPEKPNCSTETAIGILGPDNVFTDAQCPPKIKKPQVLEKMVMIRGTIPIAEESIRSAPQDTSYLFLIPGGMSISLMKKAYPEMFSNKTGLIPEIENAKTEEENPCCWVSASRLTSLDAPVVLLLIEAIYIQIAYRIATGRNFFSSKNVVCFADYHQSSAITLNISDDGVISFPALNFSGKDAYAVGRIL